MKKHPGSVKDFTLLAWYWRVGKHIPTRVSCMNLKKIRLSLNANYKLVSGFYDSGCWVNKPDIKTNNTRTNSRRFVSLSSLNLNNKEHAGNWEERDIRLIGGITKFGHVFSLMLAQFHWLPVRERILFKILFFVRICPAGCAPVYLKEWMNGRTLGIIGLTVLHFGQWAMDDSQGHRASA